MKLSDLDIIIGRNIVLQSVCFQIATEIIYRAISQSVSDDDPITHEKVVRDIGMKASETLSRMSDDEIRQVLAELDNSLHLAIFIKGRGLVSIAKNLPVQFTTKDD